MRIYSRRAISPRRKLVSSSHTLLCKPFLHTYSLYPCALVLGLPLLLIQSLGPSLGEDLSKVAQSQRRLKMALCFPLIALSLHPHCFSPSLHLSPTSPCNDLTSFLFPFHRVKAIDASEQTRMSLNQKGRLLSYLMLKFLLALQDILTVALDGPASVSLLLPGSLLLLPHLLNLTTEYTAGL